MAKLKLQHFTDPNCGCSHCLPRNVANAKRMARMLAKMDTAMNIKTLITSVPVVDTADTKGVPCG